MGRRFPRTLYFVTLGAIVALGCGILLIVACRRDSSAVSLEAKVRMRDFWRKNYEGLLRWDPSCAEVANAKRIKTLLMRMTSTAEHNLFALLVAEVAIKKDVGQGDGIFLYYDELRRLTILRVREYDNAGTVLLCEDYELLPTGRGDDPLGGSLLLPITRREADQLKDVEAWRGYVNRGVADCANMPPILMSMGGKGDIVLYD